MSSTCPYCADPIEEGHTFCPHCGESLGEDAPVEFVVEDEDDDEASDPATLRRKARGGPAERPGGVTAYAWANSIFGVLWLLAALVLIPIAIWISTSTDKLADFLALVSGVIGGFALVVGILLLAMGVGLFRLRRWARILAIVVSVFHVVLGLLNVAAVLVNFTKMSLGGGASSGGLGGAVLASFVFFTYYGGQLYVLIRPDAKEAFEAV